MLAKVCSAAVNGIEAYLVEVEVNSGWGDTVVVIVGLPDAAVKESRDRVSTALSNSGFKFPMGRTTINLAPADVKKDGPSFDLPIAVGMLAASEQIESNHLDRLVMVGDWRSMGCPPRERGHARRSLGSSWLMPGARSWLRPSPSRELKPRRKGWRNKSLVLSRVFPR